MSRLVTISVVSHDQLALVVNLLDDVVRYCDCSKVEFILTLNIPEALTFKESDCPFPIKIVRNTYPKGFGENHNQAFSYATGRNFCVLNPDIRFKSDPFPLLLDCLNDDSFGVVAPLVLGENEVIEDSARYFPTPFKILVKALAKSKGSDYEITGQPFKPDWVGGMFLLFKRNTFEKLNGFDQRYFLYYEDVDICARLRLLGYEILLYPQVKVFHYAQRTSHANYKYLKIHLCSMIRFFMSPVFWRVQLQKMGFRINVKR